MQSSNRVVESLRF